MKRTKDLPMSYTRRDFLKASGMAAGGMLVGPFCHSPLSFGAEVFPSRNINYLVPSNPGSGRDLFARAIAPFISKYLREVSPDAKGSTIVIRNQGAGGGQKAYSMLFGARPDGYTLGSVDTSVITDNIVEKPEFDFTKLTFLALGYFSTKMIVTSKNGFKNWNEVAAAMKKEPVYMSVASFGASNHVAGIILNEKAGTNFKIINFPGPVEGLNAVMRGNVQVSLLTENVAVGLLEAGELRVLLELTKGTSYPGAVSLKEIGFEQLADSMSNSNYIVATPNLAEEPKRILIEAIRRATNDKQFEAIAKKGKFTLGKKYGKDAGDLYLGFIKYYESIAPILLKHLK